MKSILNFNTQNTILRVSRLNLVLSADIYRPWTWRDLVTRISQNPTSILYSEHDRLQVAKNVSFEIKNGDRIGLIGVNGAGKTSLCRCIAGIYTPTSGKIEKFGKLRAIFDTGFGIQPELTGRENVELLAHFIYAQEPNISEIINDALEFSELGKFLDVPFRLYSNGMQARLCLSLISCRPCDLLILDEVFDGADVFFRKKISERVKSMIENSGAVIFVSHSFEQIKTVCNRILVMHRGEILYDGNIKEGIDFYEQFPSTQSTEVLQRT